MPSDGRYDARGVGAAAPTLALTGAVLAGGASRRFGTDKSAYVYRGRTLLQHALASFEGFDEVLVVGSHQPPGVEGQVVRDIRPGFGAASGLHASLVHARHAWVAALACDMPFVPPAIWPFLLARAGVWGQGSEVGIGEPVTDGRTSDPRASDDSSGRSTGMFGAGAPPHLAVVPEGPAGLEPLAALYHRGLVPALESALDSGGIALRDLLHRAPVRVVPWAEVRTTFDARVFINANRPDDLP